MKKLSSKSLFFLRVFFFGFCVIGCSRKQSDPAPTETVLTQTQLNSITSSVYLNITGTTLAGSVSVGHVITDPVINPNPNATFRDIYSNGTSIAGNLAQGTVIVKRIFLKDGSGNKAGRSNVYVMVKQYPGYYAAGGDWSYYAIKYDPAVINDNTPNGLIASALLSGKVSICADCHSYAGSSFVFTTN